MEVNSKKSRLNIIQVLTEIFLNSVLHPYVQMFLNILQFFVILSILLDQEIANITKETDFLAN